MKYIITLCIAFVCYAASFAQHKLVISISHAENKMPLNGATAQIKSLNKSAVADSAGTIIFTDLPAGMYSVILSYAGLEEQTASVNVPQAELTPALVSL